MGVDLRLLPVDYLREGWGYSHTILPLPRNYECWDAIKALGAQPLGLAKIASFIGDRVPDGKAKGERYYGDLTEDSYGEPYTYLRAGSLGPVLAKYERMEAAAAYLNALPPDTLVVLDWH